MRRQHSNDSCQWSFEQPPFSIETPHFTYPHQAFWLSLASGSQVLNRWEQRSVDLPGRHGNSQQHQMSRDLANHNKAESSAWLALRKQRMQGRRGEKSLFVKRCSLPRLWSLSVAMRVVVRGYFGLHGGVLGACWGPSQSCTVGCECSERCHGLVVSSACSWAVTRL